MSDIFDLLPTCLTFFFLPFLSNQIARIWCVRFLEPTFFSFLFLEKKIPQSEKFCVRF